MSRSFRLGGNMDALALSAIGGAVLTTSPYFETQPTAMTMALAATGSAWVGKRVFEGLHHENVIPTKLNLRSSKKLIKKDGLLIGYRTDSGKPVYLPDDMLSRHVLTQGGSGFGKTELAKLVGIQQIMRGGGLLYVDAKLDSDDLNTFYQFATWAGRAQDLMVINPGNAAESHTYNPILYGDEDEVADRILALIPASEDNPGADHYRQAAKQGLATLIGALKACGTAYNFIDLSILITNQHPLQELEDKMRRTIPHHRATKNLSLFLEQYKGGFGQSDQTHNLQSQINIKRLKEMFGGIGSRLHAFGTGSFEGVTSSYSPEVKMYEAMRDNKIIYLRLPTMGKPEASFAFAKMALADFRTSLSWFQVNKGERPNPVFLALFDEFASYAMRSMDQPFEQGRSAGVSLWPLFQTYGQLDKVSRDFKQIVNSVTATKIYFGLGDPLGAEEAANIIGQTNVVKEGISSTARKSLSTPKIAVAPEGGSSDDMAIGFSESEELDYRVSPDEVRQLDIGEAVVVHKGGELFHIKIPKIDVEPTLAKEIGPFRISHILTPTVKGCDYFKNSDRYLTSAQPPKPQPQKKKGEKAVHA